MFGAGRIEVARRVTCTAATLLVATILVTLIAACEEAGMTPADLAVPTADAAATAFAAEPSEVPPTPTPTAQPTPARVVELAKAVAAGEVAVTGYGVGLERLEIELRSRADEPLRVVVNPGTVFDAGRSAVQAMVVTAKSVIPLEPRAAERTTLDVACSEMSRDQPGTDDRFTLVRRTLPSDLRRLLALPALADEDFRVRQFAIWTILEDPPRGGYVALGCSELGCPIFGTQPTTKEIARIRALFAKAGVKPAGYRATR
jgi:hypothetical protein